MRWVCLLLAVAPASAQRVVALEDALDLARTRSVAVLRAGAATAGAAADLEAARAERWPTVFASGGAGQRYGLAFDQTTGGLTQSTVEAVNLGVGAEIVVFDGSERQLRARSAEIGLEAARLAGGGAAQGAVAETIRGYLEVAQARAALEVAASEVEAQRAFAETVRARVELGARPPSEVAEQAERVAAAQARVVTAQRDLALAHARLVRLLGLEVGVHYTFPAPAPSDLEADNDLEVRADIRAADAAARAAQASARAATASRSPRVSLVASAGTDFTSAGAVGFGSQLVDNRAGGLGLRVSLPVLDGGATGARVRQAQARADALALEADDARRQAALEVEEAGLRVAATEAALPLAAERVGALEVALEAGRARYDAGAAMLQDVSDLGTRLVSARTDRAVLEATLVFERLLLEVARGTF